MHPINFFFLLFQTLDLEISFSNLAKAEEHVGQSSSAEDKIKSDPQSPRDAHTSECLAKSPNCSFSRNFQLLHSLLNFFLTLMLTNIGKNNSEALVMN